MFPSQDNRITDKERIREIMHAHMLKPHEQKAPWITAIFSREHRKGGIIYEGAKVISSCTIEPYNYRIVDNNGQMSIEIVSDPDANCLIMPRETEYTISIGTDRTILKLSLIEYIILED